MQQVISQTTMATADPEKAEACPSMDEAANAPCRVWSDPPPLRSDAWSEPAATDFSVRGLKYMEDKKKYPSLPSAFDLLAVDLIRCQEPFYQGMCSHPNERIQKALRREAATGVRELPKLVFAVNLCVPGTYVYHKVAYFGTDNVEEIEERSTPFGRLMYKFIYGEDDQFRNATFKLIPRIVEGNALVRKAVGKKPSILGRTVKQRYIRTDRFVEVIVDIASDSVARRIMKLVLGYTKSMTVDMMFTLEGNDEETLPERIFGGVRMKGIDFKGQDGQRVCASVVEEKN